jgi:hypothetical protein
METEQRKSRGILCTRGNRILQAESSRLQAQERCGTRQMQLLKAVSSMFSMILGLASKATNFHRLKLQRDSG